MGWCGEGARFTCAPGDVLHGWLSRQFVSCCSFDRLHREAVVPVLLTAADIES